jgi:hypothetical protein
MDRHNPPPGAARRTGAAKRQILEGIGWIPSGTSGGVCEGLLTYISRPARWPWSKRGIHRGGVDTCCSQAMSALTVIHMLRIDGDERRRSDRNVCACSGAVHPLDVTLSPPHSDGWPRWRLSSTRLSDRLRPRTNQAVTRFPSPVVPGPMSPRSNAPAPMPVHRQLTHLRRPVDAMPALLRRRCGAQLT